MLQVELASNTKVIDASFRFKVNSRKMHRHFYDSMECINKDELNRTLCVHQAWSHTIPTSTKLLDVKYKIVLIVVNAFAHVNSMLISAFLGHITPCCEC